MNWNPFDPFAQQYGRVPFLPASARSGPFASPRAPWPDQSLSWMSGKAQGSYGASRDDATDPADDDLI